MIKKLLYFVTLIFIIILSFSYLFENYVSKQFYRSDTKYQQDPIVGFIKKPNESTVYHWPEHPNQTLTTTSNNFGFREDDLTNITPEKNTIRVLFTGDSHTDGVLNNRESFVNLTEEKLNKRSNHISYEFINAGTGYYSFPQYVTLIQKHLNLAPKEYVVCIYLGNDFIENIFQYPPNAITSIKRTFYRIIKRIKLNDINLPTSQHLNQLLYFKLFPQDKIVLKNRMHSQLNTLKAFCRTNQIKLSFYLIPHRPIKNINDSYIANLLNLDNELLHILEEELTNLNLSYTNLTPLIYSSKSTCFWEKDHHLNTNGHAIISDTIYRKYSLRAYD